MREYILKRVMLTILTIIGINVISFVAMRLMPGDPAIIMTGEQVTDIERLQELRASLGLDKPIYIQYFIYLKRVFVGDWGRAYYGQQPVLPMVAQKFGATLLLATVSMVFAAPLAIGLGVISAKRGKIDGLVRVISLFGFSIPTFWIGLLLILIFAVNLHWLPSIASVNVVGLILPGLALGIWAFGTIARVTRSSVLDLINQDFVLTARAKGLRESRILYVHVLKNALIPVITLIGLRFGVLLSGAVVTETIFSYPGVGRLLVDNIYRRDYTVVQGCVLFTAMGISLINLFLDIIYMYIDPRVRYKGRK